MSAFELSEVKLKFRDLKPKPRKAGSSLQVNNVVIGKNLSRHSRDASRKEEPCDENSSQETVQIELMRELHEHLYGDKEEPDKPESPKN